MSLVLKVWVKNSATLLMFGWYGSIKFSLQYFIHFLKTDSYCLHVDALHEAMRIFFASFVKVNDYTKFPLHGMLVTLVFSVRDELVMVDLAGAVGMA